MFENNFNFHTEKEIVSNELRKLIAETKSCSTNEEYDYLTLWKTKLMELSGNN